MEDDDVKKMFETPLPKPNENRKKEALNLAVAAFEAQKSAISENNAKGGQGLAGLLRLISHRTTNRSNNMTTSHKKLIAGGLVGGLATACIALMIYSEMNITGSTTLVENQATTLAQVEKVPGEIAIAEAPAEEKSKDMELADSVISQTAAPMPTVPPMQMAEGRAMSKSMGPSGIVGGAAGNSFYAEPMVEYAMPQSVEQGRDKFSDVEQNAVQDVKKEPVSTFSIDVDTASYSFVRQSLDNGVLPQADAVRVEEMVNYFDYAYPGPDNAETPFKANVSVKPSPWNKDKQLITIGIKGYDVKPQAQPDSNLVFLLDTSGSMDEPNKLPLLKQSLSMLLDSLKPTDKVSIVVYAGSAGTVLQPTPVSEKGKILQALQNLSAGGSTAGGEGIRLAYQMAQSNFDEKAINRVILATDGDFNVGITEPDELQGFVEREREKGIFLSVLGFGRGNYNDDLMQKLAQNGNGVAAYIDTVNEARKVLVQEASAALFPIAKDVKIQVEFNPTAVSEYRLVGYETRALKTEDFNNDKVDAGDIGAGAEVTAIYEVTPVGGTKMVDDLRYGEKVENQPKADSDELAFVKIRYKLPKESESKLITTPVTSANKKMDAIVARETAWAEAVAGFAQILKGGKYTGTLSYDDILKAAQANKGDDPFGYRAEFISLIHKAKTASSLPTQDTGTGGYEGGIPMPMER